MFILANIAILQLMIPDLVGPVSLAWIGYDG